MRVAGVGGMQRSAAHEKRWTQGWTAEWRWPRGGYLRVTKVRHCNGGVTGVAYLRVTINDAEAQKGRVWFGGNAMDGVPPRGIEAVPSDGGGLEARRAHLPFARRPVC